MTNGVNGATAMTNAVDTSNEEPEASSGVNAVQLCRHCRQPITLLTLIVTRTAAHVARPRPTADPPQCSPPVALLESDGRPGSRERWQDRH